MVNRFKGQRSRNLRFFLRESPRRRGLPGAYELLERCTRVKAETMADTLNLIMLVCASVGSMAFGVLAAYGIFRVGFAIMRPPQPRVSAVKAQVEAAI